MRRAGVPEDFVGRALEVVRHDQGLYDLLELWAEAPSQAERDELLADVNEAIDDWSPAEAERPRIPFDDLERIATDVVGFKKRLRDLIDQHGGVTAVAMRAGIPQPSLSRMLGSAAMPRRTTLYRIAKALDVSETEIATEWTR
jgi:hypothetical protein